MVYYKLEDVPIIVNITLILSYKNFKSLLKVCYISITIINAVSKLF
jgi:5,10-methylenetetrahydrofolate reductase